MAEPMQSQEAARAEDRRQLDLLAAPFDEEMSGRTRYSAAMYFYQRGLISAECLEVYRICARIDHENPAPFLEKLGLTHEIEAIRKSVRNTTGVHP
jgi:hypothetical protein